MTAVPREAAKPLSVSQSKVTLFIFLLGRRGGEGRRGAGGLTLFMLRAIEKLFYCVEALPLQKDVSSFKNTAEVRRNIAVSMNQLCHYRSIRSVRCSEINFNDRNDKNSVGIMSLEGSHYVNPHRRSEVRSSSFFEQVCYRFSAVKLL